MKVYNNNQLYKSPAGDQLWNSGRQNWIFGRIGDQEGAISDPVYVTICTLLFIQEFYSSWLALIPWLKQLCLEAAVRPPYE